MYALPAFGKGPSMKYEQVPLLKSAAPVYVVRVLCSVLSCVVGYENSMPETV